MIFSSVQIVHDCKYFKNNFKIITNQKNKNIFFSAHHTICAQSLYAFRETIAEIIEQGYDLFKQRHIDNVHRLHEGLQNIGLELFVEKPEQRLPTITSIRIPHGINIENVMKYMMERYAPIL